MNEDALREELDRQATSMMERQEGEATALHKLGSHQTAVAREEPANIRETGLPCNKSVTQHGFREKGARGPAEDHGFRI